MHLHLQVLDTYISYKVKGLTLQSLAFFGHNIMHVSLPCQIGEADLLLDSHTYLLGKASIRCRKCC